MSTLHIVPVADQPEPLKVLGETVTVFAGQDPGKPFEVHIQEGKRGGGPPPHTHPWDEAFYVLEGTLDLALGDETFRLAAGSFVHIPANTVHAYTNASDTTKTLAVVSDCKGGEMFAAFDAEVHELPRDVPKMISISEKLGVDFKTLSGNA